MFNFPQCAQAVNPIHEGLRKGKGIIIGINIIFFILLAISLLALSFAFFI